MFHCILIANVFRPNVYQSTIMLKISSQGHITCLSTRESGLAIIQLELELELDYIVNLGMFHHLFFDLRNDASLVDVWAGIDCRLVLRRFGDDTVRSGSSDPNDWITEN